MIERLRFVAWVFLGLIAIGLGNNTIDMSLAVIKGYDLKLTEERFNHDNPNELIASKDFEAIKTHYEDAYIGFTNKYHEKLEKDVNKIVEKRNLIRKIDIANKDFYSNKFKVKVCIDDYDIKMKDTSMMTKLVYFNMQAYMELYDASTDALIYSPAGIKFVIANKFYYQGLASDTFIETKTTEHWISQIADRVPDFVSLFQDNAAIEFYEKRLRYPYRKFFNVNNGWKHSAPSFNMDYNLTERLP